MEKLGLHAKISILAFALLNTGLTVHAETIGTAEMGLTKYYWILLLALLALLASFLFFGNAETEDPIEVLGLVYDKDTHQLELTIRNTSEQAYRLKSALRLLHDGIPEAGQANTEDGLRMMNAKSEANTRTLYDLLAEDDGQVNVSPGEMKTITYDVILPKNQVNLDSTHNVEVHINYGEGGQPKTPTIQPEKTKKQQKKKTGGKKKKAKKPKASKATEPEIKWKEETVIVHDIEIRPPFQMKTEEGEIIAEPILIQELYDAVKDAPKEAIAFHLREGNDFADWIRTAVGDNELSQIIREISTENPEETRKNIMEALRNRKEELPEPGIKPADQCFLLKTNHENILNEITLISDMRNAIQNAPIAAIAFHLRQGNDFADWVEESVGDKKLAAKMRKIQYEEILDAKDQLVEILDKKIKKQKK